jgi:hypothetical protein
MEVVVKNIINSTIAVFHNDGLLVFSHLEKAFSNKEHVELSFEGIERCATQFLNACVGKLYLLNDPTLVDSFIQYNYANLPNLEDKIREVRDNAINSKEYDSLVNNASN